MFRQKFDYCCHWLLSHSRHGTHSPFVYRLVDEVVYKTHAVVPERVQGLQPPKANALVNRILDDWLKGADTRTYVLVEPDTDYKAFFYRYLPKVNSGTLLIFREIYKNKANKGAWREIIQHERVSVGIDLFYIGLVFFREGQAKENFRIRY